MKTTALFIPFHKPASFFSVKTRTNGINIDVKFE